MKFKILFLSIFITFISLHYSSLAHEPEEGGDYFTLHMQEILFELGCLDKVTGVNDYHSIEAIKAFQKKAEINVDGLIGKETFEKIMLREVTCEDSDLSFTDSIDISTSINTSSIESEVTEILEKKYIVVGGNCSYSVVEVSENDLGYLSGMTLSKALITRDEYNTWRCITTIESSSSNSVQSRLASISATSYAVSFGDINDDDAQAVVVDSVGNTYITGHFRGTVDFGGGNITSGGHRDIYVLKLDSTGAFVWVQTYGSTSNLADRGLDIDIDSSSNVYITGYFQGTVDFGNGDITASGGSDIFVLKLDSSGAFQWVYTAGGAGNDNGKGIAVDTDGNILLTGIFSQTIDFGGGTVSSEDEFDFFVLKLNSAGAYQWVYTAGSNGDDEGLSIDTDSNNNSYITGYVKVGVDFGVTHNFYADSDNSGGIFVLKLNSEGVPQWANKYGKCSTEIGYGIAVDSSGNSYITGKFGCNTNFGGITLSNNGGSDYFVLKLNSAGVSQWAYSVGSSFQDIGYDIAIDSSGNSYTTGRFAGTINFGSESVTANAIDDIFVLKLDSSGTFQWVYTAGGIAGTSPSFDVGYGIAVDSSGNIYTAGIFQENIELTTGVNIVPGTGNSSYDALIFKLNSSGQYSD